MMNYTLKYKTFDQLLNEVSIDFRNYDLEDLIEPQALIKVAKRVNYDLGLRITQAKEDVIEIEKGKSRLPLDFYTLNYAVVCDEYTVETVMPQGTTIEEVPFTYPYQETPTIIDACDIGPVNCTKCNNIDCSCGETTIDPYDPKTPYGSHCIKPRVFLNCKGEAYELIQRINTQTRTYKTFIPIRIVNDPQTIDCDCPNIHMNVTTKGWIKDGFLFTNFDCGNVYINYQGMLEDNDGNLLVPDHDLLNEYYEYALKQRLLENIMMNGDDTKVAEKINLIEARLRDARNNARSFVDTPNFAEMKSMWKANRKAQYYKYYDAFKSYPGYML